MDTDHPDIVLMRRARGIEDAPPQPTPRPFRAHSPRPALDDVITMVVIAALILGIAYGLHSLLRLGDALVAVAR